MSTTKNKTEKIYFFSILWRRFDKLPLWVLHPWQ